MRRIQRHRHPQETKAPRIFISQEEILADLQYPAGRGHAAPARSQESGAARRR